MTGQPALKTMTGAQASYLKTLCKEAGAPFDPSLTKAKASKMTGTVQAKTGRGRTHQPVAWPRT